MNTHTRFSQVKPDIVTPDKPGFHLSLNGRNGLRLQDVYELAQEEPVRVLPATCRKRC